MFGNINIILNRFKKSGTQKKSVNTGQEVDKVDKKRNEVTFDLNTSAFPKYQENNTINRLENNPSRFTFSDDVTIGFNTDNEELLDKLSIHQIILDETNEISAKDFLSNNEVQRFLKDNNIKIDYVENLKMDKSLLLPFANTEVIFKNCKINSDIFFEGEVLEFDDCKFKDNVTIYSENKNCSLNIIDCKLPEKISADVTGNERIKAREHSLKIRGNYNEINIVAKNDNNTLIGGLIDTGHATIVKGNKPNQIQFLKPNDEEIEPSLVLKLFGGSVIKPENLPQEIIQAQVDIVKSKNNINDDKEAYKECLIKEDEKKIRVMTQNKELRALKENAIKAIDETKEIEDSTKDHSSITDSIDKLRRDVIDNNKYTWEELHEALRNYYNLPNPSSINTSTQNGNKAINTQGINNPSDPQDETSVKQDDSLKSEAQGPVIETIGEATEEGQQPKEENFSENTPLFPPLNDEYYTDKDIENGLYNKIFNRIFNKPDIITDPDNNNDSSSLEEARKVTQDGHDIPIEKDMQEKSNDSTVDNATKTAYQKVVINCKDATLTVEKTLFVKIDNLEEKYDYSDQTLEDVIPIFGLDKKETLEKITSMNIEIPLEFTNSTITFITDDFKIYKRIMDLYQKCGFDDEGHLKDDFYFNSHLQWSTATTDPKLYQTFNNRIYRAKPKESSENGPITSENNTTTEEKLEQQYSLLEFKNGTKLYLYAYNAEDLEIFNGYKNAKLSNIYLNKFRDLKKLLQRASTIDIEIPLKFRNNDGDTVFTLLTHDMETHNKIIKLYKKYCYTKDGKKVFISKFIGKSEVRNFIKNDKGVGIVANLKFRGKPYYFELDNCDIYKEFIKLYNENRPCTYERFIKIPRVAEILSNNIEANEEQDHKIKDEQTKAPEETKSTNKPRNSDGESKEDETENGVSTPPETDVQPQRETETETENDALIKNKEYETTKKFKDAVVTFRARDNDLISAINETISKEMNFKEYIGTLNDLKEAPDDSQITSLNIKIPLNFNDGTIIFYANDIDGYMGIIGQYISLKSALKADGIVTLACNNFLESDGFEDYIKKKGIIYTISDDSSITMYLNDVIVKYQTSDLYGNKSLRRLSGDCFYIDLFDNKDWNSFSVKPTEILVPLEFEDENSNETILFKVGSYDIYKRLIDLYNTYSSNQGKNLTSFDGFKNSSEVAEFINNNMVTILDENNQNDTQNLPPPDFSTGTKNDNSNTEQREEEILQKNATSIQPLNGEYFDDNDIANGLYCDYDDDDFLRRKRGKGKDSRERKERRRLKGNF